MIQGEKEAETIPPIHCAGNDQSIFSVRKSISDGGFAGSCPRTPELTCPHVNVLCVWMYVRTNQPTASVVWPGRQRALRRG